MERPITGFHQDDRGDWVAELGCGHGQHVRHAPPFTRRPWVLTEEGRASKRGALLPCVRCDGAEIPEGFVVYRRTDDFTAATIPRGLTRDHTTRPGVWGRIVVLEGTLRYVVPSTTADVVLTPERTGTVVPEQPHHVEALGEVRFHVEFLRAPCAPDPQAEEGAS